MCGWSLIGTNQVLGGNPVSRVGIIQQVQRDRGAWREVPPIIARFRSPKSETPECIRHYSDYKVAEGIRDQRHLGTQAIVDCLRQIKSNTQSSFREGFAIPDCSTRPTDQHRFASRQLLDIRAARLITMNNPPVAETASIIKVHFAGNDRLPGPPTAQRPSPTTLRACSCRNRCTGYRPSVAEAHTGEITGYDQLAHSFR